MNIISDFLDRYQKEYDFYSVASRLVAQRCEIELEKNGIRAIITHRAKRPDRLKEKIISRNISKRYNSVSAIYTDIVDLAGVRIALYFPGDMDEVEKIIKSKFRDCEIKIFPNPESKPSYSKRFSGYHAKHCRVKIDESDVQEEQKRYAEAKVEIQIASILVHAWAEVEHDLVYKPLSGVLSDEEYAILDELNGLVLAGEIALERLQKAAETRLEFKKSKFNNHFELSAYIYSKLRSSSSEPQFGSVGILLRLLRMIGKDNPTDIDEYLKVISNESEVTLSDQIIDNIVSGNQDYHKKYLALKEELSESNPFSVKGEVNPNPEVETAVGNFISNWIRIERLVEQVVLTKHPDLSNLVTLNNVWSNLYRLNLDKDLVDDLKKMRVVRNEIMHGSASFNTIQNKIDWARKKAESVVAVLQKYLTPPDNNQDAP